MFHALCALIRKPFFLFQDVSFVLSIGHLHYHVPVAGGPGGTERNAAVRIPSVPALDQDLAVKGTSDNIAVNTYGELAVFIRIPAGIGMRQDGSFKFVHPVKLNPSWNKEETVMHHACLISEEDS